jgi:glycosyltransferase involved in cell wall biosynthesis
LFLTPQLPYPPEQGTSLRNFNIIRGLVQQYRVTLLSFVDSPPTAGALEHLNGCDQVMTVPVPIRSTTTRLRRMVVDGRPDMAHRLQSVEFSKVLTKLLEQDAETGYPFDIVQVEGIEMAFAIELVRGASPQSRILFDNHNAEHMLQRRSLAADRAVPKRWPAAGYSWIQVSRLRRYERWVCNSADHVVAVSEEDRRLLLELGLESPVSVVPNSIDVLDYAPVKAQRTDIDLVFVGKMDYRPNVDAVLWFANEIWPHIRQSRPETTLAIVGQKPHSRLSSLSDQDGMTITGRVEKVQPYLRRSQIFIMPFRVGGGTRLKLIEAMASARPVVSTTIGAEGFDVESGEQLILADEPSEFAQAILELLDNRTMQSSLGERAQRFAEQYDWRRVAPRFAQIYSTMLSNGETQGR